MKNFLRFFLLGLTISSINVLPIYSQKLVNKGRLIGVIKNDRNEPLVGAVARISNSSITIQTNINGNFEVDLDPGTYTATISYVGHETKEISGITVRKGEIEKQEILLKNTGNNLQNIVVTATSARKETVSGVYRIQKNNTAVSDVLSTEQIRRTPDNNVGQSLARMNGVTVTQGKFVVIRGMGERYNNVLINGSQLPSTEPDRKNFSFDLLPASLIDNIVVTKTATPDLPADFAGGVVMVTTKEVPEKNTVYFQAGSGYNSNSTGKPFYSTKIDQGEYLGFLNSKKKWFLNEWNPVEYYKARNSRNLTRSYEINAKIPNHWGYYHIGDAAPTQEYQVGIGLRKKFNTKSSFGVIGAATYRNEQLIESYTRQTYFGDSATGGKYAFTTNLSGLLSFAYNVGKSKFALKNIYSRRLNYDTYIFTGRNNSGLNIRKYGIYGNMVDVFQNRLEGEHAFTFKEIKLKWYVDRSNVNRDQPETRTMSYQDLVPGDRLGIYTILLTGGSDLGSGGIFASNLNEKRLSAGFDLQMPFSLINQKQLLKLGYFGSERKTDFIYSFLRPLINEDGNFSQAEKDKLYGLPDYSAITERYLRQGLIIYKSVDAAANSDAASYTGKQKTYGGYAMTDFKFNERIRLVAGVRFEDFDIKVNTALQRDSAGKIVRDSISHTKQPEFFPSANIIYSLSGKSNLRLSFSRTTARPDFREQSPVPFYDFVLPGTVLGNTRLTTTSINNIDVRYELYPTPNEIFTFTLFYKRFKNPIETLAQPTSSNEFFYFNVNQASSTNIGAEIDIRKSFAFINDGSKLFKNLFISTNASYMSSNVKLDKLALAKLFGLISGLPAVDTKKDDVRKRPLQGLSPYSINAGILYQGEKYGLNTVFNRFGKRLVFLGTESHLDFYENPRNVLDLQVYGKFLKQRLEARLNFSDILNNYYIYYNNSTSATGISLPNDDPKGDTYNAEYDFVSYRAKRGTGISLALSYRF